MPIRCFFMMLAPLIWIGCRAAEPNASNTAASATAVRPALICHLAFFKLKNSADADELIADCDRLLGGIPGVVCYASGKHLDTGRGERVDGDYDVGFMVGFNTAADLARYVEHPDHVAAVNKWRSRWTWIRVHDVIDPTP